MNVDENDIYIMKLQEDFKIICLQEIGEGQTALVMENLRNRQIRFLRITFQTYDTSRDDVNEFTAENLFGKGVNIENGQRYMELVQLGVFVSNVDMQWSPLLKYRSIAKFCPETEKYYQLSIVLRKNGSYEIYSDFMLVHCDKLQGR